VRTCARGLRGSLTFAARAAFVAGALSANACTIFESARPVAKAPEPQPAASPDEVLRDHSEPPDVSLSNEDDFVVRVVAGAVTCSGALIAPDRVLTAHHCVAVRGSGGKLEARDMDSSEVHVELGGGHLPWGEVGVRAIVAPQCGHAAGVGDIAILVLSRPVRGVATRSPELDRAPEQGAELMGIGFGRCASSNDGVYRKLRMGLPVTRIENARFLLQAAICPGDSGGPAVSLSSGRILGVVSRSVMDADEATLGLTELTRLDVFRAVFATAALVAEGASVAELPPVDCR
jgi:hypothetical protein